MTPFLSLQMPCPSCQNQMRVSAVHCDPCDVTVQGRFQASEFAQLSGDDLYFLRVFVLAEGRIREMEGPLGLSYPTIRSRLSKLKEKLLLAGSTDRNFDEHESATELGKTTRSNEPVSVSAVLDQLESGELDVDDAVRSIIRSKKAKRSKQP